MDAGIRSGGCPTRFQYCHQGCQPCKPEAEGLGNNCRFTHRKLFCNFSHKVNHSLWIITSTITSQNITFSKVLLQHCFLLQSLVVAHKLLHKRDSFVIGHHPSPKRETENLPESNCMQLLCTAQLYRKPQPRLFLTFVHWSRVCISGKAYSYLYLQSWIR